ncbi:alpha-L-glutamate ligase-like protein, partial [Candidatus Woesebacteria bacterium]|nr:alpha-L-glutamate ligase-like protein [Candidatus Woesebacteria bacterium]
MKVSSILGLNARTKLFSYQYNSWRGKRIAQSKILTARVLTNADIPVPKIIKKFLETYDILSFDWESLPGSFVIKPSKGLGGEGIVVIKKRLQAGGFLTTQRKVLTIDDLKLHTADILEGAYSFGNVPDVAFIQEFVGRHKAFRRYAYRGTPDIRIIVFNKVPVMAMLRFPTKESAGRANLHQGAIGVGIDIATGITTKAIWHGEIIRHKPGTKRKLNGIKIPSWNEILTLAVKASEVSNLSYVGVDIVIHPERGPMVLELNSQPGLQIQLANMAGLKKRLERVDELTIRNPT